MKYIFGLAGVLILVATGCSREEGLVEIETYDLEIILSSSVEKSNETYLPISMLKLFAPVGGADKCEGLAFAPIVEAQRIDLDSSAPVSLNSREKILAFAEKINSENMSGYQCAADFLDTLDSRLECLFQPEGRVDNVYKNLARIANEAETLFVYMKGDAKTDSSIKLFKRETRIFRDIKSLKRNIAELVCEAKNSGVAKPKITVLYAPELLFGSNSVNVDLAVFSTIESRKANIVRDHILELVSNKSEVVVSVHRSDLERVDTFKVLQRGTLKLYLLNVLASAKECDPECVKKTFNNVFNKYESIPDSCESFCYFLGQAPIDDLEFPIFDLSDWKKRKYPYIYYRLEPRVLQDMFGRMDYIFENIDSVNYDS